VIRPAVRAAVPRSDSRAALAAQPDRLRQRERSRPALDQALLLFTATISFAAKATLLTLFFLSRYRITRERHREILGELDRRRERAALSSPA